jgi:uncharacterized protein (TIGR02246 family)
MTRVYLFLPTAGERTMHESLSSQEVSAHEQQIRQRNRDWFKAEQRKDVAGTMAFIADEAVLQPANAPPVIGKDAIERFYTSFYELPIVGIGGEPTTIEVAASGDLAYDVGTNYVVVAGPEGPEEDQGKYLLVWKKLDDEWKAVAMSYSSDALGA